MPGPKSPKSPRPIAPATPTPSAAKDALRRGAWTEAREHLEKSISAGETAEALEDLGLAAWWLDDAALTFAARERSYSLYRDGGDERGAARVAIWLVWDYLAFRGDFAVASGWMERARRLLTNHENAAEYGWLLIREAEVALFRGHDPAAAIERARRAAKLGRDIGDPGVEFTGLALEGLAMVSAGDVVAGMRCLDEATLAATAGEMKELHAVGLVCCWQIFACERVRDYDRAAQWCARVQEFTKRWGLRPLSAVCRTQYAGVLVWRGEWGEAEDELMAAARELEHTRPAMAGPAVARLGELRLRQGRFDEAERLFEHSSGHPIARLGRAVLALEHDNADDAAKLLDQFLSDLGAGEATTRAGALELAIRAHSLRGDSVSAKGALAELQRIATAIGTVPLAASVMNAQGIVLRQGGDLAGAANFFEKAVELFEQSGAPFETARARLDLAGALVACGRTDAAERETQTALKSFQSLGAKHEEARARQFSRGLSSTIRHHDRTSQLTERQVEILKLVAEGLSNPDIAKRLRLSDHTVKRHVANLLTKLGLASRAAAVAHAAKEGLL
jgi:LuxR family maltose regulon positive regulatory protein